MPLFWPKTLVPTLCAIFAAMILLTWKRSVSHVDIDFAEHVTHTTWFKKSEKKAKVEEFSVLKVIVLLLWMRRLLSCWLITIRISNTANYSTEHLWMTTTF